MHLRTLSWSPDGVWCRDVNGRRVYLGIRSAISLLVKYSEPVTEDMIEDLLDEFQPDSIVMGIHDNSVISMRNPILDGMKRLDRGGACKFKLNGVPICTTGRVDEDTTVTWEATDTNPEGPIFDLWKATGIKPYSWMYVMETADEDIVTEYDISPSPVTINSQSAHPSVLFWDIEALSETGEFTDATKLSDRIFSISVVTLSNTKQTRGVGCTCPQR
jgi:hypothetical protein